MKRLGITTTVPSEVLLAGGYQPLDLNNVFVTAPDPERLVGLAERMGFPQSCCAWIKGIYGVCLEQGVDTVLGVTTGDCSNTLMLLEVLKLKGVQVIAFAFPASPEAHLVQRHLEALARELGTSLKEAERVSQRLMPVRRLAWQLDDLTWRQGVVSGKENHQWLVSTSDFNGDYQKYGRELAQLLYQVRQRRSYPEDMLRLAYIGVPPVFAQDLYPFLERQGARVVFNEVQRQFSMPSPGRSLGEQYANYTYPYSVSHRVADILHQLRLRRIDGIIHYVQAFCHRGIADIVFRHSFHCPILTLEGNDDFYLTQHLRTRIEAYLDVLRRSQRLLSQVNIEPGLSG